jgi:hypothetical protein
MCLALSFTEKMHFLQVRQIETNIASNRLIVHKLHLFESRTGRHYHQRVTLFYLLQSVELQALKLQGADRLAYERAVKTVAATGVSADVMAAEYAKAARIGDRVCAFLYRARRQRGLNAHIGRRRPGILESKASGRL